MLWFRLLYIIHTFVLPGTQNDRKHYRFAARETRCTASIHNILELHQRIALRTKNFLTFRDTENSESLLRSQKKPERPLVEGDPSNVRTIFCPQSKVLQARKNFYQIFTNILAANYPLQSSHHIPFVKSQFPALYKVCDSPIPLRETILTQTPLFFVLPFFLGLLFEAVLGGSTLRRSHSQGNGDLIVQNSDEFVSGRRGDRRPNIIRSCVTCSTREREGCTTRGTIHR